MFSFEFTLRGIQRENGRVGTAFGLLTQSCECTTAGATGAHVLPAVPSGCQTSACLTPQETSRVLLQNCEQTTHKRPGRDGEPNLEENHFETEFIWKNLVDHQEKFAQNCTAGFTFAGQNMRARYDELKPKNLHDDVFVSQQL